MYTHFQLLGPLAFLLVSQCFMHRPGLIWGHLASLSVASTLWENTHGVLGMSLHTSGFCKTVYGDLTMQALKSPFLLLLALACHLLRPESYSVSMCDLLFSSILFSTSPVCKNSSTGPFHSLCVPASFQRCFVFKVCASALPKGKDHAGDVSVIFLLINFSSTFLSLSSFCCFQVHHFQAPDPTVLTAFSVCAYFEGPQLECGFPSSGITDISGQSNI